MNSSWDTLQVTTATSLNLERATSAGAIFFLWNLLASSVYNTSTSTLSPTRFFFSLNQIQSLTHFFLIVNVIHKVNRHLTCFLDLHESLICSNKVYTIQISI